MFKSKERYELIISNNDVEINTLLIGIFVTMSSKLMLDNFELLSENY